MILSAELISDFAKTTNDSKSNVYKKDTNMYGTVIEYGGSMYVRLDGSSILTPIETTSEIQNGDRVIVRIGNHEAIVTGNITNPSSGTSTVKNNKDEILAVVSEIQQDLNGFKSTVSGSYVSSEDLENAKEELLNSMESSINTAKQEIENSSASKYIDKETHTTDIGNLTSSISSIQQDLTGFESTVSSTFDSVNNYVSQVEQKANKISFIISSGESSSGMVLTDEFYNVVSDNITLSADRINLEGLTTVNENFKILTDGTCESSDLVVTNNISANTLTAEIINVPWIAQSFTRDVIVHINPSHEYSTEDYTLEDEDTFKSISDLLEVCPRNLNGYKLEIYLDSDITENVSLIGLNNGRIDINLKGHAFKGYILGAQRSCRYYIYGNDSENTGGTTRGKIIPGAVGYLYNDRRYAICCKYGYLTVFDVDLYSGTATDYDNNCITLTLGANGYLSNVKAVNSPNSLLRCQASSHCYVSGSSGTTTVTPFQSISGSIIQLNDTKQTGRVNSTNYIYEADNGKVFADGVTWDKASSTDSSSSNTNTETTTTITKTIKSDYGDSYRTTKYYNWKKDNTVRQGQYGYGMNKGLWFFGNDIYDILKSPSNTIISMSIIIKRQTGGSSSANTHYLRAHTHKSRPSGVEPTLLSSDKFSKTFSLSPGNSITISLNSSEINALKTNGVKGFGLYTTNTSTGLYSVCSGSCVVKIKYKTITD